MMNISSNKVSSFSAILETMEKIPLFGSFKRFIVTQRKEITKAVAEGEWVILVLYLFFVGCVLYVGYLGIKATYNAAYKSGTTNIQVINPQPPFELEYKVMEERKQENGLYKTIFEVSVIRPQGNFRKGFYIINGNNLSRADCYKPEEIKSEAEEQNGRQIYERGFYKVECTSELPIIDNRKLFAVKGTDN